MDKSLTVGRIEQLTHTAGPWDVVKHAHVDDELWLSVNQHADAQGMREWIAEIKYLTTDPARQWANANLIAAAPELLKAAQSALEWCEQGGPCDWALIKVWRDELKTAIAKAEGR